METDKQNPLAKMVITGSPENKLFYDYLDFNKLKYDTIHGFQSRMKKAGDNKDSVSMLSAEIGRINQEIIGYKLDLVQREPASFIAFMINAMKEPEIPEAPILLGGRRDSTFAYNYYKSHFWDGTDFTDDRVLRTPVFHNKLKKYFSSVLIQVPDTIIKASDNLIDKARGNPEMFKYLVWFSTYTFENSDIMGFDAIFVHVADRYYATGEATWVSKTTNDNIVKKANRLKPLLIGKKAPEMIMVDTSNQLVSMHNIRAKVPHSPLLGPGLRTL